MHKKIYLSLILLILLSCGGGYSSSYDSNQPTQATQPAAITIKNVPESLSMIE